MKVSESRWELATINLIARRLANGHNNDNIRVEQPVRDYKSHIEKCGYGDSVLDVGCGSQYLKECLPEHVQYIGLDAFPIEGLDVMKGKIENLEGIEVDTVCAFAVLDNCHDFFKACDSMKRAARKNIVILTGIGIEVDQYHTHKLELSDFTKAMEGWQCTRSEEIQPKVWLLNYQRLV
jgi:SAM-dependent methyltransferase